jgi:cytochrome d ubiquinol oxidase subunit II
MGEAEASGASSSASARCRSPRRFVSPRIFEKWFTLPEIFYLAPLPIISGALLSSGSGRCCGRCPLPTTGALAALRRRLGAFALAYLGMAYSFYPYVVPERLTIYEAAAAPKSLLIILIGACVVVPVILGYSVLAYVIFRGKATALRYD